ncbi:hypothetical protein ABDJ41_20290 [Pedobacter sp. ASV1-7]|uniref:hypothetical protein n=1 Tax=Pedobacter sp. ASV1-7 TaxID=3145237 RepID=UPI0032E8DD1D
MLELPEQFKHLYIHKKDKSLINAETALDQASGIISFTIYRVNGGNGLEERVVDDIFTSELLPQVQNNILIDVVNLGKYLKKNGYKIVTKVTQTKNGTKFG